MASYMRWAGRALVGGAFVAGGFVLGGPLGAAAGGALAASGIAGLKAEDAAVVRTRKSFREALDKAQQNAKDLGDVMGGLIRSMCEKMGEGLHKFFHGVAAFVEMEPIRRILARGSMVVVDGLEAYFRANPSGNWIADLIGGTSDVLREVLNIWMGNIFGLGLRKLGDFLNWLSDGLGMLLGELFGGAAETIGMLFFGFAHTLACATQNVVDIGGDILDKAMTEYGKEMATWLYKMKCF